MGAFLRIPILLIEAFYWWNTCRCVLWHTEDLWCFKEQGQRPIYMLICRDAFYRRHGNTCCKHGLQRSFSETCCFYYNFIKGYTKGVQPIYNRHCQLYIINLLKFYKYPKLSKRVINCPRKQYTKQKTITFDSSYRLLLPFKSSCIKWHSI